MPQVAGTRIVLDPMPPAHFGAGAVNAVAGIVGGTGCQAAVIVTDQGLAGTAVVASVVGVLAASGIPVTVFSGVHANPTTGDVAAGADAVAALAAGGGRPAVVAVGGGSSVDAAKGIAVAAVNPERGRDLDYRRDVLRARPAAGGGPDHRGHRDGDQRVRGHHRSGRPGASSTWGAPPHGRPPRSSTRNSPPRSRPGPRPRPGWTPWSTRWSPACPGAPTRGRRGSPCRPSG